MPVKEFSKSMKAKMYDFTYTPFMSSMVIAWIVLNHKYLLIYMSSYDLDKKLKLLENYDFSLHTPYNIPYAYNIFLPIFFGLLYTFLYPIVSKVFYDYTLKKNKELKKLKQKIEEDTPILIDEAIALKKENYDNTDKISELEEKITSIRSDYDIKITNIENITKDKISHELNTKHQKKIKELKQDYEKNIKETQKGLEEDYKDAYQKLMKEKNTISEAFRTIETQNKSLIIENQKLKEKIPKEIIRHESDRDTILKYFYTSNYKPMPTESALDSIVNATKIARPKVNQIIETLKQDKVLEMTNNMGYSTLAISDIGNTFLVKKFDKETK